jgi:hypothetical protein
MYAFGFDYDATFLRVAGRPWGGLDIADRLIEKQATAEGVSTARYRAMLRRRYKDIESGIAKSVQGPTGFAAFGVGKPGVGTTAKEEAVAEEIAK